MATWNGSCPESEKSNDQNIHANNLSINMPILQYSDNIYFGYQEPSVDYLVPSNFNISNIPNSEETEYLMQNSTNLNHTIDIPSMNIQPSAEEKYMYTTHSQYFDDKNWSIQSPQSSECTNFDITMGSNPENDQISNISNNNSNSESRKLKKKKKKNPCKLDENQFFISGGRKNIKNIEIQNNRLSKSDKSFINCKRKGRKQKIFDEDGSNFKEKTIEKINKSTFQKYARDLNFKLDNNANQNERLTNLLNRGILECLICCEYIKQSDYIWSCKNCYYVLHLRCIKKWSISSKNESGWRCPACQNVTFYIPSEYYCFCGKVRWPEWNRMHTAHSCGEICDRLRSDPECSHKCTFFCHPGSCPSCTAMVTKLCGCGRTSKIYKCSSSALILCENICDKTLNCGIHLCGKKCHHGNCESCDKFLLQDCYCGKYNRRAMCVSDFLPVYSCQNVCGKTLSCDYHQCKKLCHPGECGLCSLLPQKTTICHCTQTVLKVFRKNCLDPIPTCDKVCKKPLKCGEPDNPHTCQENCHQGNCPGCKLSTKVKCRCGYKNENILCEELLTLTKEILCEKKCLKLLSCGKHRCNKLCCADNNHLCLVFCPKNLSCGKHKCEEPCHKGRCRPCWRSTFDEISCECGKTIIYPPVPCGTRPPNCEELCKRSHFCSHTVLHNCHSNPDCPPCTVLTEKWCYGKHKLRKSIPCYIKEISCGLPCDKTISCGQHKCISICHDGKCEKSKQLCVQPCAKIRKTCGHACNAQCHKNECPDVPCKEKIQVYCQCRNRSLFRSCGVLSQDYKRIVSGVLAKKMADVQLGHTISLDEVFDNNSKKLSQVNTLECNEDCKTIERNRRLALGLQIVNPDLAGKLMPQYSEFLKHYGKKNPVFCQLIHDKLTELVTSAKTSKQKSRSYSFEIMNKEKRTFVHELCKQFGCLSQAYDQEPKRNVVATAVKDKCWLPNYSLKEILQREQGQRKAPKPIFNNSKSENSQL